MEYGWLETGTLLGQVGGTGSVSGAAVLGKTHPGGRRVPVPAEQALWNTLVLVGHTGVLVALFATLTPALYAPLARCRKVLGAPHELQVLQEVYATLPVVNFSRAILTQGSPLPGRPAGPGDTLE